MGDEDDVEMISATEDNVSFSEVWKEMPESLEPCEEGA
jgi:hypothetical protein